MLLNEVFEKEVSKKPDHLFSEFEGKKITYNEANIIANNLANALISEGLKKVIASLFCQKIVQKWRSCITLHPK